MASETGSILRAAWAWTGARPAILNHPEVWVQNGLITWIGCQGDRPVEPGLDVLDLGDTWLLPGFIDAHLHLFGLSRADPTAAWTWPIAYRAAVVTSDLRRLLDSGITAVRCLGSPIGPAMARAVRAGDIPGPHVSAAGAFICGRAGTWDPVPWPRQWAEDLGYFADGPDACRQRVRERIRDGSDFIKIGGSVGGHTDRHRPWGDHPARQRLCYTDAEVAAVVEEAHGAGLKVASHCIGDAAVRQAVRAGVDTIEHGHGISAETCRLLADSPAVLVPTLSLPIHRIRQCERDGNAVGAALWDNHRRAARDSLEMAHRWGVRIAMGTDFVGPPCTAHGPNACEMEFLVEAGLTAEEALTACIVVGRQVLGLEEQTGALTAGLEADIIGLPGDPRADIALVRRVAFVMKGGAVQRSAIGG